MRAIFDRYPILSVLGAALMLPVGFLHLVSGLVAPPWAVGVLWVTYASWIVVLVRWWRAPVKALLVPFLAYGTWFLALTTGGVWLGWAA